MKKFNYIKRNRERYAQGIQEVTPPPTMGFGDVVNTGMAGAGIGGQVGETIGSLVPFPGAGAIGQGLGEGLGAIGGTVYGLIEQEQMQKAADKANNQNKEIKKQNINYSGREDVQDKHLLTTNNPNPNIIAKDGLEYTYKIPREPKVTSEKTKEPKEPKSIRIKERKYKLPKLEKVTERQNRNLIKRKLVKSEDVMDYGIGEYKDGGWIKDAAASIERRGTEGKCTPITKPGCTGRALALAKTFKKIAAKHRSQKAEKGLNTEDMKNKNDFNIPEGYEIVIRKAASKKKEECSDCDEVMPGDELPSEADALKSGNENKKWEKLPKAEDGMNSQSPNIFNAINGIAQQIQQFQQLQQQQQQQPQQQNAQQNQQAQGGPGPQGEAQKQTQEALQNVGQQLQQQNQLTQRVAQNTQPNPGIKINTYSDTGKSGLDGLGISGSNLLALAEDGVNTQNKKEIEVEGDEVVLRQQGDGSYKLKDDFKGGPSHKEGGIPYMATVGDVIFPAKQRNQILRLLQQDKHHVIDELKEDLPKHPKNEERKDGGNYQNQNSMKTQKQTKDKGKYPFSARLNSLNKYARGGAVNIDEEDEEEPKMEDRDDEEEDDQEASDEDESTNDEGEEEEKEGLFGRGGRVNVNTKNPYSMRAQSLMGPKKGEYGRNGMAKYAMGGIPQGPDEEEEEDSMENIMGNGKRQWVPKDVQRKKEMKKGPKKQWRPKGSPEVDMEEEEEERPSKLPKKQWRPKGSPEMEMKEEESEEFKRGGMINRQLMKQKQMMKGSMDMYGEGGEIPRTSPRQRRPLPFADYAERGYRDRDPAEPLQSAETYAKRGLAAKEAEAAAEKAADARRFDPVAYGVEWAKREKRAKKNYGLLADPIRRVIDDAGNAADESFKRGYQDQNVFQEKKEPDQDMLLRGKVYSIQKLLKEKGHNIASDGMWGPQTEKAFRQELKLKDGELYKGNLDKAYTDLSAKPRSSIETVKTTKREEEATVEPGSDSRIKLQDEGEKRGILNSRFGNPDRTFKVTPFDRGGENRGIEVERIEPQRMTAEERIKMGKEANKRNGVNYEDIIKEIHKEILKKPEKEKKNQIELLPLILKPGQKEGNGSVRPVPLTPREKEEAEKNLLLPKDEKEVDPREFLKPLRVDERDEDELKSKSLKFGRGGMVKYGKGGMMDMNEDYSDDMGVEEDLESAEKKMRTHLAKHLKSKAKLSNKNKNSMFNKYKK
jgi:hypothetical protein